MIVMVESNFVLELALQQEESEEGERILRLAEAAAIELIVPACALSEPYETLIRRRKERNVTLDRLTRELNLLSRSRVYAHLTDPSRAITEALAQSGANEAKDLEDTIRRLLACATISPLSKVIVASALNAQTEYDLEPQDAIVFASVDEHLKTLQAGRKLFINKNHKDFLTPAIEDHFDQYECKLLPKLTGARQFIEHEIGHAA